MTAAKEMDVVCESHGEANPIAVHRISLVSHEDFFVFASPSAPFLFRIMNRRMIVIFTARFLFCGRCTSGDDNCFVDHFNPFGTPNKVVFHHCLDDFSRFFFLLRATPSRR